MTIARPGAFVPVVGPSGVGKDSVIREIHRRLADDARFVFARRVITRQPDGSEDHDTMDEATFSAAEEAGAFSLSWRAHGLGYGIPRAYEDDVRHGRVVLANLSRGALDEARRVYPRTLVFCVTAPPEVVAKRLAGRGRETPEDIEQRLKRGTALPITGENVVTIDNGRRVEDAAADALSFLHQLV